MIEKWRIRLEVNGKPYESSAEPRMTLADFLREELRLTGTHLGCEHGVCGACTVLLEGQTVRSCLMLAVQADGLTIQTVEGLASEDGTMHPIQEAFAKEHALQCGFCTPGFLLAITEWLSEGVKEPSEEDIRARLSGNLCRCTGYHNIVRAVQAVTDSGSN